MFASKMRFYLFFALLFPFFLFSQQKNLPLNKDFGDFQEKYLAKKNTKIHSGIYPLIENKDLNNSLQKYDWQRRKYKSWLGRKFRNEHFIEVDTGEFSLRIDPLLNLQYFKEQNAPTNHALYTNTRGVIVQGNITSKVSFSTSFLENQSFFPTYMSEFVTKNQVVPGSGRVKPFKQTGFDYAIANGYVSYSPNKKMNFQFGKGKHFIGEGYRSLLLSDNSFNYPYFRSTLIFFKGKLQLTNIWASLQSLDRIKFFTTSEAPFKRKAGTFYSLSYKPTKNFQISFFEGIIWQRRDSTGTTKYNYNYLNPIIGANSLIYGLNDKNNAILGATFKYVPINNYVLYGQLMLDDPKNKQYGYQMGAKAFDLFGIKNLWLQIENNYVTKNTYSHELNLQTYSHYNLALAHPLGNNFNEYVTRIGYRFRDFFIRGSYIRYRNTDNVAGVDYIDGKIGYIINSATNMHIELGARNRSNTSTNSLYSETKMIYFALRTSLSNRYFDF